MELTGKQATTIAVCAAFIVAGILTIAAVLDDDEGTTSTGQVTVENRDSMAMAGDEVVKDSFIINEPLDTDPYKELDELIGLKQVKEEVRTLANFVKVQRMREEKGMKVPKMSYHLVFTGSPGTGKTTVARIVARIYKDLGILKKGHTVETDRSGLVAEYVGQTAMKTNAIIDSALNGVLFIDEAYALVPEDSHNDFGQEAISTLLKRMEDDRDKLVVIIAGYTDEMQRFIDSNPGLQSRFNHYIKFPDYSAEELYQIFQTYLKANEYTMTEEAGDYLKKQLKTARANKDRNFGNARYVRNLFEKAIEHQANRIAHHKTATKETLSSLELVDIKKALNQK